MERVNREDFREANPIGEWKSKQSWEAAEERRLAAEERQLDKLEQQRRMAEEQRRRVRR